MKKKITQLELIRDLSLMGFTSPDGTVDVLSKTYKNGYVISIVLGARPASTKIDYGAVIDAQCGRATTKNFSQSESLVVLECVDKLLMHGYPASSIFLEQPYTAGRTQIWLDIKVAQGDKTYLMIDCKTWGDEFDKAKKSLFSKGGQLLSYYLNDRDAKFIAYYSSQTIGPRWEREVCAVDTTSFPPEAATLPEIVNQWDKSHFAIGLIESDPFQVQEKRLTKSGLRDLNADDKGKVFHSFNEILRRHVVSDKPNAFNKLFNLFICKIYDEEKDEDEILDFQWSAGETTDLVIARLTELYRKGMQQFLSVEIPEFSESTLMRGLTSVNDHDRSFLLSFLDQMKAFGSQEFSFKEVYDRGSYASNTAIVREVVRLLQLLRLRYGSRQPFMGEFFELLLGMSVKQESGQFFTPIPLAKFIFHALPVAEIVRRKISEKDPFFMPYVLDFAAGSGHFVNTALEIIDQILQKVPASGLRKTQKQNRDKWVNSYEWAGEFVYAIEKDYRLAKASKVSTFLNGDGDAKVICADGLDSFALSADYIGRLKLPAEETGIQDNPQFDIIAANPPYAVDQCRATVPHGSQSFFLFNRLQDTSNEIECLFVERMKQTLKAKGVVGIILPISILTSEGIETDARTLIFDNFLIKALVLLGQNTFMATSSRSVILFAEKREARVLQGVNAAFDLFLHNWLDVSISGISKAFSHYVSETWDISYSDWLSLMQNGCSIESSAICREFKESFESRPEIVRLRKSEQFSMHDDKKKETILQEGFVKFVREQERSKMALFIAVQDQEVLIVKAPKDSQSAKSFLGYEFSRRRGQEGLRYVGRNENIETPLFDDADIDNETKISFLIRSKFLRA